MSFIEYIEINVFLTMYFCTFLSRNLCNRDKIIMYKSRKLLIYMRMTKFFEIFNFRNILKVYQYIIQFYARFDIIM